MEISQPGRHFNPQGPRGPRRNIQTIFHVRMSFQSTRPSRASTSETETESRTAPRISLISIPKALAGLDALLVTAPLSLTIFQSTRPSRASTPASSCISHPLQFQSTRPSRASTLRNPGALERTREFQSTRPSRASTLRCSIYCLWIKISIHKALAGLDNML